MILWIKALHVVAVISWMAGLLYIYRLFVYHAMETEAVVRSRFEVMERRLLNAITTPAGLVALVTGTLMIVLQMHLLKQPWMHAKLTLVLGMIASHVYALRARKRLLTEPQAVGHKRFRVLNEIPTLLMIGIVIFVVVRPWAR
ncbi:MAG: CopD family protein [Deltaproteobacteria bacterium]|nr:CopD family protein [Deltaproteobacteria bacterium]